MPTYSKPLLSPSRLVQHMKDKGITFRQISEKDAAAYLTQNNYYFKLASYRKNYETYQGGESNGQYINLDFEYLRDLANIDMELRYVLIHLALDIEHFAKLNLLNAIEKNNEDAYSICNDFIASLDNKELDVFWSEIQRNEKNVYCGDLVAKYPSNFPAWVMLELIPFGRMISFYKFAADRFNDKHMQNMFYLLRTCRQVRNAAAHSSCIINNLHSNTSTVKTRYEVAQALATIKGISKVTRTKRMSNVRIQQIVTMLYVHTRLVTSSLVKQKVRASLQAFVHRMNMNSEYYDRNDLIQSSFNFLTQIIDNWFLTT